MTSNTRITTYIACWKYLCEPYCPFGGEQVVNGIVVGANFPEECEAYSVIVVI